MNKRIFHKIFLLIPLLLVFVLFAVVVKPSFIFAQEYSLLPGDGGGFDLDALLGGGFDPDRVMGDPDPYAGCTDEGCGGYPCDPYPACIMPPVDQPPDNYDPGAEFIDQIYNQLDGTNNRDEGYNAVQDYCNSNTTFEINSAEHQACIQDGFSVVRDKYPGFSIDEATSPPQDVCGTGESIPDPPGGPGYSWAPLCSEPTCERNNQCPANTGQVGEDKPFGAPADTQWCYNGYCLQATFSETPELLGPTPTPGIGTPVDTCTQESQTIRLRSNQPCPAGTTGTCYCRRTCTANGSSTSGESTQPTPASLSDNINPIVCNTYNYNPRGCWSTGTCTICPGSGLCISSATETCPSSPTCSSFRGPLSQDFCESRGCSFLLNNRCTAFVPPPEPRAKGAWTQNTSLLNKVLGAFDVNTDDCACEDTSACVASPDAGTRPTGAPLPGSATPTPLPKGTKIGSAECTTAGQIITEVAGNCSEDNRGEGQYYCYRTCNANLQPGECKFNETNKYFTCGSKLGNTSKELEAKEYCKKGSETVGRYVEALGPCKDAICADGTTNCQGHRYCVYNPSNPGEGNYVSQCQCEAGSADGKYRCLAPTPVRATVAPTGTTPTATTGTVTPAPTGTFSIKVNVSRQVNGRTQRYTGGNVKVSLFKGSQRQGSQQTIGSSGEYTFNNVSVQNESEIVQNYRVKLEVIPSGYTKVNESIDAEIPRPSVSNANQYTVTFILNPTTTIIPTVTPRVPTPRAVSPTAARPLASPTRRAVAVPPTRPVATPTCAPGRVRTSRGCVAPTARPAATAPPAFPTRPRVSPPPRGQPVQAPILGGVLDFFVNLFR